MTVVEINTAEIHDWDSFHAVFSAAFGFSDFYGRNTDAWIDCLTHLDDPDAGMSRVHAPAGGVVTLKLLGITEFAERCPVQYEALFEASDQRIIVAGIIAHLKTDAETETRRKKQLRPNPVAPWELRLDRFRVFYSIEEGAKLKVVAVGHKEHNDLFIQGKKVQL